MENFDQLIKSTNLPKKTGVYRFYDENNSLLYVGKAKNLHSRVNQYAKGSTNSYKTFLLIQKIRKIEYDIVANEKEALILEKEYISKYQPIYNIKLKDDSGYPYIKLELIKQLKISLVYKVPRRKNDQNVFFYGPFPSKKYAFALKKFLESETLYEKGEKASNQNVEFFRQKFLFCKNLLQKRNEIALLEEKLEAAKQNFHFELAQEYFDAISGLKNARSQEQNIDLNNAENLDFLCFSSLDSNSLVVSFAFYRNGIFLSNKHFHLEIVLNTYETLVNFLNSYYKNHISPDKLIVDFSFDKYFDFFDSKIKLKIAKSKQYKQILDNLKENHFDFIAGNAKNQNKVQNFEILELIKQNLKIKSTNKIMAIDNSFLTFVKNVEKTAQKTEKNYPTTGIIFYIDGSYEPSYSRFFNFSGSKKGDTNYMRQGFEKYFKIKNSLKPDVILVDGASNQVNVIASVLENIGIQAPIFGLVKNKKHKTSHVIDQKGNIIKLDQKVFNFFQNVQEKVDMFVKSKMKRNTLKSLLHE